MLIYFVPKKGLEFVIEVQIIHLIITAPGPVRQ